MLDMVHCKVLSVIESDDMDAYLLSESSFFVFPHKLVLKTCGITTLISGLPKMLEIAALDAGFPAPSINSESSTLAASATHRVFYSRKNFQYPDQQRGPHRSWRDEVRALDRLFHTGSAYLIGKMNGEHWYLYITEPENQLTPPSTPKTDQNQTCGDADGTGLDACGNLASPTVELPEAEAQDETLEILMTDLEETNSKKFYLEHASAAAESRYFQSLQRARQGTTDALGSIHEESGNGARGRHSAQDVKDLDFPPAAGLAGEDENDLLPDELATEGHALGSVVSDISGLSNVFPSCKFPDAKIDAYLFNPCGFSANGIIPAPATRDSGRKESRGGRAQSGSTHYFTVHVTPERHCSYASFETNIPTRQTGRQTAEIVEHVVNIFRPGRFSVTLFEATSGSDGREGPKSPSQMEYIGGYRRVDRIVHDLDGYDLVFRYFERLDWKGGAPRLGETNDAEV